MNQGSWVNSSLPSIPYKYGAYKSGSTQTIETGADEKLTFETEEFDTGGNFASSTFTAPIAGFYFIGAASANGALASATRYYLMIYKNGSEIKRGVDRSVNAASGGASVEALLQLAAGDTIDIYARSVGANLVASLGQNLTYTYGYLVSPS